MSLLRLRSAFSISSPIYQLRRRFLYVSSGHYFTPTSAAYPLPIPRDPSSPPLKLPTDLRSELNDTVFSASSVWSIVKVLTDHSNLDEAAKYARLIVMADPPRPHDPYFESKINQTCQLVIGGMCAEKRYEEACELFHYFFNVNCLKPDYDSCCYVLNALCYRGLLDKAVQFYRRAISYAEFSLKPHALVKALINAGRIDEAYDLISGRYGCSYSVFIRGYLANGNIHKANIIFEDLKSMSKGYMRDSLSEEIGMSQVVFMEHFFKEGKDEEAMEWYHSALATPYAANEVLKFLLKCGKKTEAWSLFEKMCGNSDDEEEYARGNQYTSCIMIEECCETGEISKALEIAQRDGKSVCYTTLLTALLRQVMMKQHERDPECVDDKIAMSQVAYMEHCFNQGKDEEAMEWYHSALAKRAASSYISKRAETVNKVLQVLLKNGKKTEAWSLFDKMCGNQMSDQETSCIMIQECFETGDISKAMEMARKEARAGNSRCYTTVLTRLLRQEMMSEAEEIFNEILSSGRIPLYSDLSIYLMMIDGFVKAGRFDDVHRFVSKIADASRRDGNSGCYTTLLTALMRHVMMKQHERNPECVDDKIAMSQAAYMEDRWGEETRCIMIEECFETGDISKAMEMARKEARAGNSRCYTTVLTRLLRQEMMSEAEGIFNEILSSGRIPLYSDLSIYLMMIDGFVKAGRFDDVHRFVSKIADASLGFVSRKGHHSGGLAVVI